MVPFRSVRSRFASFAFALTLVAASIGAPSRLSDASASALASALPQSLKIVAFGSSSTQGVGASSPSAAYPAQLERMLRAAAPAGTEVEVLNRGIGGEDIDMMTVRFDRDVLANLPDIVIWQTGSNDVLRNVPLDRFEAKTRAGIAAMRHAGIAVILMEPQWCPSLDANGRGDRFREAVRRIGTETGVAVIRRADLMHDWISSGQLTMTDMLSPDGLHMRDAGYRLLAAHTAFAVMHVEAHMRAPVAVRVATAGL